MKVLFMAGFGPIVPPGRQSEEEALYDSTLGLPFEREGTYLHTGAIEGVKHFALWPLDQAAESCFGKPEWPDDLPVSAAWIEFDVENLQEATEELEAAGYQLLVSNRMEPWGQGVSRFLAPDGLLVGLTYTHWMR